jgi:hypothetical protein
MKQKQSMFATLVLVVGVALAAPFGEPIGSSDIESQFENW